MSCERTREIVIHGDHLEVYDDDGCFAVDRDTALDALRSIAEGRLHLIPGGRIDRGEKVGPKMPSLGELYIEHLQLLNRRGRLTRAQ